MEVLIVSCVRLESNKKNLKRPSKNRYSVFRFIFRIVFQIITVIILQNTIDMKQVSKWRFW